MRRSICAVANLYYNFCSKVHIMNWICRQSTRYPVPRIPVDNSKVPWSVEWAEYSPPYYTAEHLKDCSWADPELDDENFKPNWNSKDGNVDRRSFDNNDPITYDVCDNYPLNPRGRTGLRGRGSLGRWGPNHAGDAVVTRWKRSSDKSKVLNPVTEQAVLQFLAIKRKDCGKWAIPGGFLNANEEPFTAVLRELFEEAINPDKCAESSKTVLEKFFSVRTQVYKGYVDDPRNTDNAWIETTACNFHDESGEVTEKLVLEARDDAADVKWIDIVEDLEKMNVYETHINILETVNDKHLMSVNDKET